jgi:UDPglucose 6-dehydrogenase
MIKYASNVFLATKISFINEIANICKLLGISAYDVAEGMGYDKRISPYFLKAGPGFGGSCFPQDVRALIAEARILGIQPYLMQSVLKVNREQPYLLVELMRNKLGSLARKKIGVLGLAFKEDTDDIRESPSIPVIKALLAERANVYTYDPKAMEPARELFGNTVYYESSVKSLMEKIEGVIVVTPWKEFLDPSLYHGKVVVDARYIFGKKVPRGIDYEGIGW